MKKRACLAAAVAAAILAVSGAASAAPGEESGWYGGLDAGRSRLGLGYRFGPSLSLEGSYARQDSRRLEAAPQAPWAARPEPAPAYGLGARYDFTQRLFGRFEWDRYSPASELDQFRRGDERYSIRFGVRF
jgi:opacity protein-like surface antigen